MLSYFLVGGSVNDACHCSLRSKCPVLNPLPPPQLVLSSRDTVTTFLEANGRGYWETSEENIELLQDLYQEVEDKIEGV